jgi:hypothetical protein
MKEENKYYTPEIEEFHVGFEYEEKPKGSIEYAYTPNVWIKEYHLKHLFTRITPRVKHLDREDIESLGCEYFREEYPYAIYKRGFVYVFFREEMPNNVIVSYDIDGYKSQIFNGTVKNKSQLRNLFKMLGE